MLLRELAAARTGNGPIDFNASVDLDLAVFRDRGFRLRMIREIRTSREWEVAGDSGQAARLNWSRYSATFFRLHPTWSWASFLTLEDLAVDGLPRTVMLRYTGDQRHGSNEQHSRHNINPGLDAAGVIGTGEDCGGYRDCSD